MSQLLLILEPPEGRRQRPAAERPEAYAAMLRWSERLKARGVLLASESLKSADEAARVEVRGGETRLRDGPFAEAKEIVGGFFLLDCGRAEAIALAGECPAAAWATVEVREVGPCYD